MARPTAWEKRGEVVGGGRGGGGGFWGAVVSVTPLLPLAPSILLNTPRPNPPGAVRMLPPARELLKTGDNAIRDLVLALVRLPGPLGGGGGGGGEGCGIL